MFRVLCMLLMLFPIMLSVYSCSSGSDIEIGKPTEISEPVPLSLEEWNAITNATEKYDVDTLERLRKSDPALKSEKAWKKFMGEVVGPQMAKDKPIKEPI
ncbi:hypothetical protein [Gimesia aquarii]|uniref:Uncharacterized protein n=1 Tax=Gimesia aquarii TaxID=2527964 RepID=A0A517W228_9PLAN|nr:hypothetical protein [Gimesia aquarii]QDT99308.1 hypothetical protein V144x_48190 [Gimesia aquarii]